MKEVRIRVKPEQVEDQELHKRILAKQLKLPVDELQIQLRKRSIDARKEQVKYELIYTAVQGAKPLERKVYQSQYQDVSSKEPVVIIGAGPAGLFAALRLIELGMKPIILERGKDVRERRRDLRAINQQHQVNEDSNYCFGEGGAGTYSDGKLYTRSGNKKMVRRILEVLHFHGAREEILIDTHPHIGTNKLPALVGKISDCIREYGGEIHFNTKLVDFEIENEQLKACLTADGKSFVSKYCILATGHSARDIFELLHKRKIQIEAKPFALGVRVEHNQNLIDSIQYHCDARGEHLPAASYKLVTQVGKFPVYSFCMCPGGFIVPSATAQEELVVNGMSPSRRDSQFANSGIVVSIQPEQLGDPSDPFVGLRFQQEVERNMWIAGGKTQAAPAQLLKDFVQGKHSQKLNDCSYQPGLTSANLHEELPEMISKPLQEAFKHFGKKMPGYLSNHAQILGTESRTSSPVRIPRNPQNLEHVQLGGLYPCGEGAGYAGGIVSAAMDGERVAEAIAARK